MLTATITLSFMMRNTSPVGWVPLLAIKVLYEHSFVPFLIAGVFIALPLIVILVAVDTWFYLGTVNGKDWVFTSWNFVQMNVIEGLSEFFGTDAWNHYIRKELPSIFMTMYPLMLISNLTHLNTMWNKSKTPYLVYYNIFYIALFSAIPHKEMRFLLPIVPFAFTMIAELLTQMIRKGGALAMIASLSITVFAIVELIRTVVWTAYHSRDWEVENYLTHVKKEPVHSFYTMDRYSCPHYSWFHGSDTKISLVNLNP